MNITGIGASDGYAIATAYLLKTSKIVVSEDMVQDTNTAIETFKKAIIQSEQDLETIRDQTIKEIDLEHAEIFNAHIQMLNDPEIIEQTINKINEDKVNPAYAYRTVTDGVIKMFEAMDDAYFKERAADIKDVARRVVENLLGIKSNDFSTVNQDIIVVADDLTPSETAQLNKQYTKAFVTNIGGRTSHSSIMARTLEIPAVVGTKRITEKIKDGDMLIVDGLNGLVIINPTEQELKHYANKMDAFALKRKQLHTFKGKPTVSACQQHFELAANIGSPEDIEQVLNNDAEGIGLYRTEFLYMNSLTLPSEEVQFEAYKSVLQSMAPKPVVIRTLDIGGDKILPYMQLPIELNPFLGVRAIRLCFGHLEIFKTQLNALLRASVYGNLKIMFPMIATVEEFNRAKAIFEEQKNLLSAQGITISDNIELGIMVEIPATALLADQFANAVDFFSIGTNDLIQYTFAADRMNEQVSYLYQPYHPAILRLVKMVIDAAHRAGKWTGMCGEMAGDLHAIPLLLGLTLDEFSMSATSVLAARELISKLDLSSAKQLVERALNMQTNDQVKQLVIDYLEEKTHD